MQSLTCPARGLILASITEGQLDYNFDIAMFIGMDSKLSTACPKCSKQFELPDAFFQSGSPNTLPQNWNLNAIHEVEIQSYRNLRHVATHPAAMYRANEFGKQIERVVRQGELAALVAGLSFRADHGDASIDGQTIEKAMKIGVPLLSKMLRHEYVAMGVAATFHSQIVGAWTAFEVLAEDLWLAALNADSRLGLIAMNAIPSPEDDERFQTRKRDVSVDVPLWMLNDPKFNPRTQMGDLLKTKWNFQIRQRALDAYERTFPGRKPALGSIFSDSGLVLLAALRNVIVHNAGVADEEFCRIVKRHPPFNVIRPKSTIPIDGATVARCIMSSIAQGKALIEFVDGWFIDNQEHRQD